MSLQSYLESVKDDRGIMAEIRRGLRSGEPDALLLRHLAAAGVDLGKDVLPEAMLAYAFAKNGKFGGISLGAAVASIDNSRSGGFSSLEKRVFRLSGQDVRESLIAVKSLVDMASGLVDPVLLRDDMREWLSGVDVPIIRWVAAYHRYSQQKD